MILLLFLNACSRNKWANEKILELCESKKIHLIEDVCESHGALVDDLTKAEAKVYCHVFLFIMLIT